MARTHYVTPLDHAYLDNLAAYLLKIAEGYTVVAKELRDRKLERVKPEKFKQMTLALTDLRSHFDQIADGARRVELDALWEKIKDPPFPDEQVDRAKHGASIGRAMLNGT